MPAQIHVGDIGTAFRVTIYDEQNNIVNVSGSSPCQLLFTKPDNTLLTKTATVVDNGISGVILYTSQSGDLDIGGIWRIQGHIGINTSNMYTDVSSFRVYDNLD